MDEFDLEVVPLVPPAAETPARASAPTPPPPPLPAPFAPRLSPRARVLRAGSILGVVLLAVVVVVAVTPGARSAIAGVVLGPTPTATPPLLPGQDVFALEDGVPWGVLTIDGQPGPRLGPAQPGTATTPPQLPTFTLARGRHQLLYRAEPFPTLQCTLSVPAAPQDTCPVDPHSSDVLVVQGAHARLLDLHASVDRLPAAEATGLTTAAQQVLAMAAAAAPPDALAPGDHYLDARGQLQLAREALRGVPTFTLVSPQTTPTTASGGVSCAGLCSTVSPFAESSASEWLVYGAVLVAWRYSATSGRIVLADGAAYPPGPGFGQLALQFGVGRVNGGWQVRLVPPVATNAQPQDLPVCAAGAFSLDNVRNTPGQSTIAPGDPAYQWPVSSALAGFGCVLGGGDTDPQGVFTGPVALLLYRCGALVAVNDTAAHDFPLLPMASAHEQALALAAWPPTAATVGPGI